MWQLARPGKYPVLEQSVFPSCHIPIAGISILETNQIGQGDPGRVGIPCRVHRRNGSYVVNVDSGPVMQPATCGRLRSYRNTSGLSSSSDSLGIYILISQLSWLSHKPAYFLCLLLQIFKRKNLTRSARLIIDSSGVEEFSGPVRDTAS